MNNNHACLVCLGSNCEGKNHLANACRAFTLLFDEVRVGTAVMTKAEGTINQADYLNQAVCFCTDMDCEQVQAVLKQIERDNGRRPEDKQRGCVSLDIDLLKYDDEILRPGDFGKEYVREALEALPTCRPDNSIR